MNETPRDGNWIDEWGSCKVCGGEIPHGHTNKCDIGKLEQELNEARLKSADRNDWQEVAMKVSAERDHLRELHHAALTMYEQCLIVQHQYEAERDQIRKELSNKTGYAHLICEIDQLRKVCDELASTIYVHSLRPQNALDTYNQLPHVERKTK